MSFPNLTDGVYKNITNFSEYIKEKPENVVLSTKAFFKGGDIN